MQNTTTINWRVQIIVGAILGLMACAAVRVDILNNAAYGMTISTELATILVLAAIGVVAIPTAAVIVGWSQHLRIALWIAVVLTVWAAANAYSAKQGADILKAQATEQRYEAARADEEAARSVLARIAEVGDVDELGKMRDAASVKEAAACKWPKSKKCKPAQDLVQSLTARISDAKARDKAKADLKLAKGDATEGPAEPNMIATVLARYVGMDAASLARNIALVLTALGIALTQAIALLGGYAAKLITGGWRARPKRPAAKSARKPTPEGSPDGGSRQPIAPNVIRLDAAKHSVQGWLGKATEAGGEMRGGEALKSYKRYAGSMARHMTGAELRNILAEILGAEAVAQRTSGFTVQGVNLKVLRAEGRKAVAR